MGELRVRGERNLTGPRYQTAGKTEKAASVEIRPAVRTAGAAASKTLQGLMSRIAQAETRTRESRRTLQVGEAVLEEVQDSLSRIAELAKKAAGKGSPDYAGLQAELEHLREEIDRMTSGAFAGGAQLFLDGEMEIPEGAEPPADAALGEGEGVRTLPSWLLKGIALDGLTPERLLSMLGLDQTAGSGELLAALTGESLDDNAAAAYLAALYLGGTIAGGTASKAVDLKAALEGLRQFMERVAEGVSPDQAVEMLTNGAFSSLAELEAQFTDGTAPGLEDFLAELLLSGEETAPLPGTVLLPGMPLLTLLAGLEGMEMDLMTGLLAAVQGTVSGQETGLENAAGNGRETEFGMDLPKNTAVDLANVKVVGRDLTGVSVNETTGELTVGGMADTMVLGNRQGVRPILLSGSGVVTLRDVRIPVLTAAASAVRVVGQGEAVLEEVCLRPGVSLTLSGGLIRIGHVRGDETNLLRLTGGAAVAVMAEDGRSLGTLPVPVVVDGPVFLAAQASGVTNAEGKPMAPFDILWRTLLPGCNAITALSVDGRQGRLGIMSGEQARLWLEKGDPSHGSPIHAVVIRGKDQTGQPKVRYAYLRWSESTGSFEETVMYPNPFTVTGGEMGRDWIYEEESHTLLILTDQVTAVTGGLGTDANQTPFSGRLVLADGIGAMKLTLGGVDCRVSEGVAFSLGEGNEVTLLLRSGTRNYFESGAGWAGISLGERTSLCVDCPEARDSSRNPAGMLAAVGGAGGAGIGRNSGGGRDQTGRVTIQGGEITAVGTGGGAGIGAGKRSSIGRVDILGGTVNATGKGGGAGIGGAAGGSVGGIFIRGGSITALAAGHAAAIGAGVQGPCGDIVITGAAKLRKAVGGDPGADIGACLFGSCGKVQISGGAEIGKARLWTRSGISLQMGAESATLPQFRLSSRALGLDKLSLAKKEAAQAVQAAVERDRRWVAQIQSAYHVLYHRLEQNFGSLVGARQYLGGKTGPVRDAGAAGTLLADTRRSIPQPSSQAMRTHGKKGMEDFRQLLR